MIRRPANPERSFGISVGTVLCVVAAVLTWRGRTTPAMVVGATGALLLGLGLIHPPLLKVPSDIWWRFSAVLGRINARVLLTVLFTIMLVPLSVIWRLTGKDPLGRRRDKWAGWSTYPSRYRDHKHYSRLY